MWGELYTVDFVEKWNPCVWFLKWEENKLNTHVYGYKIGNLSFSIPVRIPQYKRNEISHTDRPNSALKMGMRGGHFQREKGIIE